MGASVKKRRRRWRRDKRRRRAKIQCVVTQQAWNYKKSLNKNFKELGIKTDPNDMNIERFKQKKKIRDLINYVNKHENATIDDVKKEINNETYTDNNNVNDNLFLNNERMMDKPALLAHIKNKSFRDKLNVAIHYTRKKDKHPLSVWKQEYFQRLIDQYGYDYSKMQKDCKLNYFQYTSNQIRYDIESNANAYSFGEFKPKKKVL